MKRIDDKIKEIEKKDRTNRILYIAFVVLIGAFMAVAFSYQKKLDNTKYVLKSTYDELNDTKNDLVKSKEDLQIAYDDLKSSLRPEEYWNSTKKDNLVESYIDYITNDWGIDKPYMNDAINNLKTQAKGFEGWLFVGALKDDGTFTPDNEDFFEVVWRQGASGNFAKSRPQVGDVVQVTKGQNRRTYGKNKNKNKTEYGWRFGTKAFVVDTWNDPNSTNYEIKIRYY